MIVPIYAALKDTDQLPLAIVVFNEHEAFYHPIARNGVRHVLYGENESYFLNE
jgi:hypothetical protein